MPWCEACSRFLSPNTVLEDGTCPECGWEVERPAWEPKADQKAPWHFWVLVVAATVYVGWRLVQLVLSAV